MNSNNLLKVFVLSFLLMSTAMPGFSETFAFEHVNVLPMTSEKVLADQTVIVRDGRIEAIAPSGTIKVPRRSTKIDAEGQFLIPGLADLHVHFNGPKDSHPDQLKLYIANGVTSVLNMNGTRGLRELREQVANGKVLGPNIYSTSPIMGNLGPTPSTREMAVKMVEGFVEDGYDFVKVYNFIPEESYRAIMETAARLEVPVVGHAVRAVGIEGAIEYGQNMAHMEELLYGYFQDDFDEAKIQPLAEQFRAANMSVIVTLVVYHNIIRQLEDIDAMMHSPGMEYLSPRITRQWDPEHNEYLREFTMETIEDMLAPGLAFMQKITKGFQDAGVQLLTGTDACIAIVVPGFSLHAELIELVEAGLTPFETLTAGTINTARFLGRDDDFGTIEEGKQAEMILLRANPLESIENTQKIEGVMLQGAWHDRAALDEMLEEMRVRNQTN